MILKVPYQSQIPFENEGFRKWCGIASAWMVIAYFLKDHAPKAEELLEKFGEDFESGGFVHKDLLKIAREYGLQGFRKSWWAEPGVQSQIDKFRSEGESEEEISKWIETNISESVYTLEQFINQGIPLIISVSPEFSPSKSSHLVVLVGDENDQFIIHDPYKKGANFKLSKKEFRKYWLKQAIIISSGTKILEV